MMLGRTITLSTACCVQGYVFGLEAQSPHWHHVCRPCCVLTSATGARQGERTVVDTFLEHLTVASRAAETLVAALEDTQIVTADFGTSLLKVSSPCVVLRSDPPHHFPALDGAMLYSCRSAPFGCRREPAICPQAYHKAATFHGPLLFSVPCHEATAEPW